VSEVRQGDRESIWMLMEAWGSNVKSPRVMTVAQTCPLLGRLSSSRPRAQAQDRPRARPTSSPIFFYLGL
jgi:hypothetical protein